MQFKIPQNVGIEDKIVGPLTLKQLIILAVGGGISYVLFAILTKIYDLNFIEYFVIAIPLLFSIAFALIKINNIPLIKFMYLFLEFSIKPKKRIWDHRGIAALVAPDLGSQTVTGAEADDAEADYERKAKRAANLRELTQTLDSGGFEHVHKKEHEDIDTTHDDDLVSEAYFGHKQKDSDTQNMYWRTKESHMKMLDVFAKMPVTKIKKGSVEAMAARQEIAKVKKEVEESMESSPTTAAAPTATKKRRPRRKPAAPARPSSAVNTITPKAQSSSIPPASPSTQKKATSHPDSDAMEFRELEKGEIDLNLD